MARTKSGKITAKIIQAERLRLRGLRQKPEFQADLKRLEQTAKRLPSVPLIPPSDLTEKTWRLPARSEKKFQEWSDAAKIFFDRWGFKPSLTESNKVELRIRSPVSVESKRGGSARWIVDDEVDDKHFPLGDLATLLRHYGSARRWAREKREKEKGQLSPQRRRRIDTDEQRLRARELDAKGKNKQEIAKDLYPREYGDALKQDPNAEQKLRPLASQYMKPPHNLTWPEAEQKAASELGLDLRPPSVKLQKLTRRVRHLLKSSPLDK